jgi:hypothetical protein
MRGIRETLAWMTIVTTSTLSLYGKPTCFTAQTRDSCSTINYVGVGCAMFKFVGVERGKPFVAQRKVTFVGRNSEGANKSVEWIEFIARDSQGRIRFEQHGNFNPPDRREGIAMSDHEIEKIIVPGDTSGFLVTIFDCFNGKSVVLQPNLKLAHIMQTCDSLLPIQQNTEPYSHLITRLLGIKPQPAISLEDLGLKEIEGIIAHGLRITTLATGEDYEWDGRRIGILEKWMSDELAATIFYVYSDLKAQSRTESRFTNIKKGEPEASLFEIPPGYKVILTQGTAELGVKEKPL